MATRGRQTPHTAASRKRADEARPVTSRRASPKSPPRWKWIAAVAVLLIVIGVWHFLPVQEWLRALDAWIDSMGVLGGALYAALYVVASLVFVPGSILTAVAGYIFGFAGALAVVFAGTTAAAAAGFLIARYLARRPVERLAKRSQKLGTIDEAVRRTGWKMVGLLRIAAIVPFSVLNYLFGLSSVKFVPYLAATAVGMLPGTFIYAYLGASGKSASEEGGFGPLQWALLAVAVLVTVVMTAVVARFTKKHLKER